MIGSAEDMKDPLRSEGRSTCCYVEQSLQEGVAQVLGTRCEAAEVVPELPDRNGSMEEDACI